MSLCMNDRLPDKIEFWINCSLILSDRDEMLFKNE
jgi:hypothetical protein